MNKINHVGWYLLSTTPGETLREIVHNYGHPTYLDISLAYVPLYSDISNHLTPSSDFSFNIGSDTTTNIGPSDLCFNYTLGNVIDSDKFSKPFLGKINNFDENFNDSFGIWVYIYNPPTIPILNISLINTKPQYDNVNNMKTPIIKLTINDVSNINTSTNKIDLAFTENTSVNIVFERSFNFSFNHIFKYTVQNNEYINFNTSDNSNTILFSTNFSDIDLNQTLDTSSLDTSANISFTVFNSNPIQLGEKFTVNFRIDISDTIFPSIDFDTFQPYESFNFPNPKIFTNINNNVYVSIPQSIIINNITTNYRPNALFFDQNQRIVNVDSSNITNLPSNIVNPNTLLNESISYQTGTWYAGIYNFRYECTDLVNKTTVVDLSLEIIDDLQPTINIKNSNLNTINAYLTHPPSRNNNYNDTSIQSGHSDITGVGFTLSNTFTNTSNDFNHDSTRDFHFKFSELSGNNWHFPDVTSVIDWSNVDISNIVTKTNSIKSSRWTQHNLSNNFFTTDSNNFNNALRQTTFNIDNPNIIRTYQVSDNNHILTADRESNNTTTLTTQYFIWDDTIPIVDISFIHTIFKINTSKSEQQAIVNNNVYGDLTSILNSNVIQSNPIVINLYDDIEFKFKMNKDCKCKVELLSRTILPTSNNFQSTHSIKLTHTDTFSVGTDDLIFTIWDENNNFFKFKYDISINEIPSYTLKIIQDQYETDITKNQKLLLRVAERNLFKQFFAQMEIQTNQSSWDIAFSSAAKVYTDNMYGLTNYVKIFDSTLGLFQFSIPSSESIFTQAFRSSSLNNGIYYEILYFPDSPSLSIDMINKFRIDDTTKGGSIAIGEGNFIEIKDNVGFYIGTSTTLSFN